MESVSAGTASLVGGLHISANNGVADGTFTLSFQSTLHVSSKRNKALDNTAGTEYDDLDGSEPGLPVLF